MQWRERGEERRCGSMFWVVAWCAWGRKLKGLSFSFSYQGLKPWNNVSFWDFFFSVGAETRKCNFPNTLLAHTMVLTFSSQVKGHTWPVKCHTVMCTDRRSYQLCRIWSLLNQTVFTRKERWCRRRFPCIGWMCDLVARLRFYTVWGPLKRRWVVYVPQSLTLKEKHCALAVLDYSALHWTDRWS